MIIIKKMVNTLWRTAASGSAGSTFSYTQVMTLDASGNLGIGTTSPSGLLTSRCCKFRNLF